MIICEKRFEFEDPNNLGYSMLEVDFYASVPTARPSNKGVDSHRLSLRKNLMTGYFELYRHYADYLCRPDDVAAKSKSLEQILIAASQIWNLYWGTADHKTKPDTVCEHKYGKEDWICPDLEK